MKPFSFHRSKQVIRKMYELQAEYMRLHDQLEILRHPERGSTGVDGREIPLSDLGPGRLLQLHLAARHDLYLLSRQIRALAESIRADNEGALETVKAEHVPEPDRVRRHRGRRARKEARENLTRTSS